MTERPGTWRLALAMMVVLAPSVAEADGGGQHASDQRAACMDHARVGAIATPPLAQLVCVNGGVSLSIVCDRLDAQTVDCTGHASWNASAWSPTLLPGYAEWQGGSTIEWCPPTQPYCRSLGIGYPLESCTWLPTNASACASGEQADAHKLGAITVPVGACMDVTLYGFVYVQASPLVGRDLVGTALEEFQIQTQSTICS